MKAVLKLELFEDDFFWAQRKKAKMDPRVWEMRMKRLGPDKSPSWVARVRGVSEDGLRFDRQFVNGTRDYSEANSIGSRGVFCYYPLGDGVYEVNDRYKWGKVRRYFLLVQDGQKREITKEEAIQCLRNAISE